MKVFSLLVSKKNLCFHSLRQADNILFFYGTRFILSWERAAFSMREECEGRNSTACITHDKWIHETVTSRSFEWRNIELLHALEK